MDDNIICTLEETARRLEFCGTCENNILDGVQKCSQCSCLISTLTLMTYKTCPIGKW